MAIIKVLKFDGPPDRLVWKYPSDELATWSELIVHESQEALLFKGGQALDLFGPGRHTLSTQNIPVLSAMMNLPYGGKSPFTAEVWFVNKVRRMDMKWGTANPIQLQEPRYHVIVSVRAFGQFGVQIEDSRKLLLKLVGTLPSLDQAALSTYFRGILLMNMKEIISSYLIHKKISVLELHAYASEISRHMEERVAPVFEEYGLRLFNFTIDSINFPDDPAINRLREALAKKAEMDIIGYTYQQERTFNTLENAAKNEGHPPTFRDAGFDLGLGQGLGAKVGQTISQMAGRPGASPSVTCDECKQPMPVGSKFCPSCGDAYRPCPSCQADNPKDATECRSCRAPLGLACPQCGVVTEKGKFCHECGTSLILTCKQCQHTVQPGQKFCLECGNKLT
ncbi:SPFH domain-containing protein [Paenibacillus puerhi]|uniref:SPFH domain-containing protein n=1 Tax=Paenibacillus puerhi TaxID=2692622 RepID=UPI00135C2F73|nr:SPFH domain-containing protein [Paenibacillus puerhi]